MKYGLLVAALLAMGTVHADEPATTQVKASTDVKYECAKISKSDADKFYKEGHLYLDSDDNKIPCDEVMVKTHKSTAAQPYVTAAPVVLAPHLNLSAGKSKKGKASKAKGAAKKRSGSNCRTVKGYTRKDGTKVHGYTRCK